MRLINLELNGFKSFAKKTGLEFNHPVVSIVGPNGSGKSNVVEAFRFVLGEQSMKSMRGRAGSDLIFKGSKNLPKGTKALVTIYFDNKDRVFKLINDSGENVDLKYDVVSIGREVFIDGVNKYTLNGSEVRLRDIHTLLASLNIGSSGHHIISQGEADRVLNANAKDRKEMIEDALGLKIYQYKIKDAERKLERSQENMKEVTMLRRENAPHLNFLKKQVEKLEKMKDLKVELSGLYAEYLKKESIYLDQEKSILSIEEKKIKDEVLYVEQQIKDKQSGENEAENQKLEELKKVEANLYNIHRTKGEIERKLGRIEGMIEAHEIRQTQSPEFVSIPEHEVKQIIEEVNSFLDDAMGKEDTGSIKQILNQIKNILAKFHKRAGGANNTNSYSDIENLKKTKSEIITELDNIEIEEQKLKVDIDILKQGINKDIEQGRDKEREKFTLQVRGQELYSALELLRVRMENLSRSRDAFDAELKEGSVLLGADILAFKDFNYEGGVDRNLQDELHRKIERIKIKLEDSGIGDGRDILKEYEEVTERDQFLAKELEDLAVSIESLQKLMADLKEKIDQEFKQGIKKINVEFQNFFALMFGGGNANLNIVVENKKKRIATEEEEELGLEKEEIVFEQGVEINVSLPHKKVKELQSLSGGERSLTSIALLFAMSQVNPPPFLILDETDAALDEANSRKYGDMIERLSKHSQLVVVTHNRETMSRAGVLYGVTIGSDGASKLLSVRFDEAAQIAK